ncbi:nucleotide-binding protein [Chryseobacterium sp. PBS4-4]|uniref:CD-NTase-associated protein 12 n=1 Tax=Chryseobacterium edaphi TaxID=2976532 RepID=A0ABT2W300_9FLAO|nr:nucleotide-binding protein [Chryseobacterium edaphi]MCU7616601.1 nucleotide-binding protein [Chryseobacterium edaphi]
MKTRIFIGSSSEGLDVAQYVKHRLIQADFESYLWTDDIFKANNSVLETLLKEASLFDFGILVATKDDYTKKREKEFQTPRDNIIFEYGIFLGRLGTNRAFVIQEKGSELPSDMYGITVPRFEITGTFENNYGLNSEVDKIIKTIREKIQLGELGLLPSTVLAIGYFENLVSIICEALNMLPYLEVEGNQYKKFQFNIVIPKDLDADIKKRAKIYFKSKSLEELEISTTSRTYPIHIQYDEDSNDETLQLYDMPTTIGAIDKAIEMYMRKGHIGKTDQQKLLEERELRNFQTTLENLIANDAFAKNMVKIIIEE